MKFLLSAIGIVFVAGLATGCANEPILSEYMIIHPDDTVLFHAPAEDTTISITHSCTCPFSWSATISPAADTAWLTFPTYQSGDKTDVPIAIDRAKLLADTSQATIKLVSNSYGDTTITVIAIR